MRTKSVVIQIKPVTKLNATVPKKKTAFKNQYEVIRFRIDVVHFSIARKVASINSFWFNAKMGVSNVKMLSRRRINCHRWPVVAQL